MADSVKKAGKAIASVHEERQFAKEIVTPWILKAA